MVEQRDHRGRYGVFGGRFVSEALWAPLEATRLGFLKAIADPVFNDEFRAFLEHRVGRPTPITYLSTLSKKLGGAQIWLKRDDLCSFGSYCATSALFQVLLAKKMGKQWLVCESATGDFGVAVASLGNALGLQTRVFMGREDAIQEPLNVGRLKALDVALEVIDSPARGNKAACAHALRFWATHSEEAFYCASSFATPDPYPRMIAHSLSVIGDEAVQQVSEREIDLQYLISPVGSGGYAAGLFEPFKRDKRPEMIGVQAQGEHGYARSAATLICGKIGVFQGTQSYVLQDSDGQILMPHSLAGGLCCSIVGPQHAHWADERQVHYVAIKDRDARNAAHLLAKYEGVLICFEAAHALAHGVVMAQTLSEEQDILIGITGSGERDLFRWNPPQDEASKI